MATVTLHPNLQKFPPATAVSLYRRTSDTFGDSPPGAAQGNSPQTIAADGSVTFAGLTGGQGYWLAAQVSGTWQHEAVSADASAPTPVSATGPLDVTGTISATGGIGENGVSPPAQAAAIATPASPGASYVQAEVVALRTAIAAILVALRNKGTIAP